MSEGRLVFTKNSERCSLFLFVLCLLLVFVTACGPSTPQQHVRTFSGPIMGTEYRITVIDDQGLEHDYLEQILVKVMQTVNQSMSTYIDDSELNQVNNAASGQRIGLSPQLAEVLAESLHVSDISDGAFDVTLANVISAWGFGPNGLVSERPSDARLAELKSSVGYQKLSLGGHVLTKLADNMRIDLSAIAKGFAVDQVAEKLLSLNINHFLINIGGELRAAGTSGDSGRLWQVGIEKPHILGGIQQVAVLDNQAIATSGDYRNYVVLDEQQFSHMIDPQTLTPVYHKLALVSVIAQRASTADALATAMMAMGESRAASFAEQHQLAAYMVIREPGKDQYRIEITEKFRSNLR